MKTVIVLLALCMSNIVFASATLIYKKGNVLVSGKKAISKQVIKRGQKIVTGDKSLAIIKLSNGSKIKIEKNSSLLIETLGPKQAGIKMSKGQAFFNVVKSKLKNNKPSFTVKTQTVAMGVRGTEFFVALSGKEDKQDVWMCVREGLVGIKSKKDKSEVFVKEGEGVVSRLGTQTSKPKPLEWTKKLNWNMNTKKGSVVNKVSIQEAYSDLLDQDYD